MIDRKRTRTTDENERQENRPGQMVGPILGVDKQLDDRGHPEQRQDRQAASETQHEKYRAKRFKRGSQSRSLLGGNDRQSVLVAKQRDRALPAMDFGESGMKEDAASRNPRAKLHD